MLLDNDPYLKLSPKERISARRERRSKFPIGWSEPSSPIVEIVPELPPRSEIWFWIEEELSPPKIEKIQSIVMRYYSFTRTEFVSQQRTAKLVLARQIAMYLAKTLTIRSLPEIGRLFGGRDHTTVLHSVRKIARLLETDLELVSRIEAFKLELRTA